MRFAARPTRLRDKFLAIWEAAMSSTIFRSSWARHAGLGLALALAAPMAGAGLVETFDPTSSAGYTGLNIAGLPGHPNAMPAPFETGPDASSDGRFLRLKEFTAGRFQRSFNALAFDRTDAGLFDRVVIDFDFRVTCGGTRVTGSGFDFRCADGFSVGWMSTDVIGTAGIPSFSYSGTAGTFPFTLGENGTTGAIVSGQAGRHESFALGFNTFDNFEGSNNSLNINFNDSNFVPRVNLNDAQFGGFDIVTGGNRSRGDFQHAQIDLLLGGPSPHVTVVLTDALGNTITPYDIDLTGTIVNGLPVAPYDGRLGFFTRTGDSQESVDLDNINVRLVNLSQVPEPGTFALAGIALAAFGAVHRRRAG
jgi:hypothetical protein